MGHATMIPTKLEKVKRPRSEEENRYGGDPKIMGLSVDMATTLSLQLAKNSNTVGGELEVSKERH
jgi:hypothetical protein